MAVLIGVALVGPLLLGAVLTVLVRTWARRSGFVDRPHAHKKHEQPVALGGGIAIFAAIAIPLIVGTTAAFVLNRYGTAGSLPTLVREHMSGVASKLPTVLALCGCMAVLHAVGLIDDRRALGPGIKFAVQFAVALVTAWPLGIRILEFFPASLSVVATVLWIVLITNAFNFLDNMDGLSAGVAAIGAAIFAIAAMLAGQVFVPVLAWIMVGALVGFLLFNFSPASIFMGDAGSLVVGYLMAVLTTLTTYFDADQQHSPLGVLVPLLVLAVPVYDAVSVITLRLVAGESPFRGDHRHFSHRLVKRGMTRRGAVLTIYLATAATGLPAVALPRVDWPVAALLLLQCICVVAMIAVLEHTRPAPSAKSR